MYILHNSKVSIVKAKVSIATLKSVYSLTEKSANTLRISKNSGNETGKVTGIVAKQSTDANFALVLKV